MWEPFHAVAEVSLVAENFYMLAKGPGKITDHLTLESHSQTSSKSGADDSGERF